MNNKPNSDRSFLHFMLRAQQLARQDARSDQGYAMMTVSIISIVLFSMLAAYMMVTNISKSSTNAYIDGTNTFYAAESGLNRRAEQLRQKFIGYATPANKTAAVNPVTISNCFTLPLTTSPTIDNDFECRNYPFKYNNNIAQTNTTDGSGAIVLSEQDGSKNSVQYTAYTFVKPKQDYTTTLPSSSPIPAGEAYAGLNALEYRYTVYSTAAKPDPLNPANPVEQSDGKTVLQMDFKSRIIPLFQFAAFYKDDLEMTSTSTMTLSGRVHTNGNLYAQPTPTLEPAIPGPTGITTYFYSPVTSAGDIYNRNDASGLGRYSAPRVLQSGNPITGTPTPVYYPDSNFRLDTTAATPLSSSEISAFGGQVRDGTAGATSLETPDAGFLRKRNYFNNKIGEYYAKSDLRLEMIPDRDVSGKAATPWTRNSAIIPFNFTSIQTGGAGACTTAVPTAGSDPAPTYIDPARNNASTLRCNVFTKGQLQSLRQPVLVKTHLKQIAALRASENAILGKPATLPTPPALSSATNNDKILRALQIALLSSPSPVGLDQLDTVFSDPTYDTDNVGTTFNGSLNTFKTTFGTLLNSIGIATGATDYNNLLTASPNQIAALEGAWFLPAPIQRIENNNPAVQVAANFRNSGFYDGRERRWITMLQTNLLSLSVWNRDGLYVDSPNNTLTLPYTTTAALRDAAFDGGNDSLTSTVSSTKGLAFTTAAATGTAGLPSLGLGASDATENGLVFHATVNDDLDGSGAFVVANDISFDASTPILRKNPDGTNTLDSSGNPIVVDYPRVYPTPTGASRQSSFGFAFNGGDYLPGATTLVTDQAIYVQGDFNNNSAFQPATGANVPSINRRPAAIMGDTISILSNQCLTGQSVDAGGTVRNYLNTPGGQIDCGLPNPTTAGIDFGLNYYTVTGPTAVNAAFLSSTDRSCGNLGLNRACSAGPRYSGGLNNYMRMLENWGAIRNFNYSGSFVSLGTPLEYNGLYFNSAGNYYNIPVRNYNFETNFNSFSLLPPLSPSAIYLQQEVFKRTYN